MVVGNIKAMRNLTYGDHIGMCISAVLENQMVKDYGMEICRSVSRCVDDAVTTALAKNKSTFAVLSVDEIMKADGFVARLKAKGYVVEEP